MSGKFPVIQYSNDLGQNCSSVRTSLIIQITRHEQSPGNTGHKRSQLCHARDRQTHRRTEAHWTSKKINKTIQRMCINKTRNRRHIEGTPEQ